MKTLPYPIHLFKQAGLSGCLFILFWMGLPSPVWGQQNWLRNPSFEENGAENVRRRHPPANWFGITLVGSGSTPDQQPGSFGVALPAKSGAFFAGMVSRPPNGPSWGWESLCQKLPRELKPGTSYTLLAYACFDPNFQVVFFEDLYKFQDPIPLSLYAIHRISNPGPNTNPFRSLKLGSTPGPINHREWKLYSFSFSVPETGYDHVGFAAEPPNGGEVGSNILIDEVFLAETPVADSVLRTWAREDSIETCRVRLPSLLILGGNPANRLFRPDCHSVMESHGITVYNRWGKKVYETEGTTAWWEGKDQSGNPLEEGIYFYDFRYTYPNRKPDASQRLQGWVKILRGE